jgi:UDPglucose 6-dehydrogenase
VRVTDPQALANAEKAWPDLTYRPTPEEAAQDADVVLLLTEWREYRDLDPGAFGEIVAGKRIIDGRNVLDPATWRAAGWTYRALGRP